MFARSEVEVLEMMDALNCGIPGSQGQKAADAGAVWALAWVLGLITGVELSARLATSNHIARPQ